MIAKQKVVLADEMIKIEKEAISQGFEETLFMQTAGLCIASFAEQFILKHAKAPKVFLLVGKGNNGADAYAAGTELLKKGFCVEAFAFYPFEETSILSQKERLRFQSAGGKILTRRQMPKEGILLDGLVGTGFKGEAKGVLAEAINWANSCLLPILAIDIPSGLCANTGKVRSVAIYAAATIYLEFPKLGFFLEKGLNYVGALLRGSFGLPDKYRDKIKAEAFLVDANESFHLPFLPRTQNKYEAGYVLILGGSKAMMGAGVLASYAALKAGAGIVRWFYERGKETPFIPLEVIKVPLGFSLKPFFQEMKRASSLVIGPGMGRSFRSFYKIKKILSCASMPMVIDADALFFLHKHPSFLIPPKAVLTPHKGEMQRLLQTFGEKEDWLSSCQAYANEKNVSVLVKGAPNFLFQPQEVPYILPFGNPGMATAGSGDVLSGILGALLAKGQDPLSTVILGTFLHGLAGDLAAKEKTEHCLIASDLVDFLPKAFLQIQHENLLRF